jgi:hypothetical protein
MAEWVHPAPSGKEPSLLAPRRFNNYAEDPGPTHEPGSLFLTAKRRAEIPDDPGPSARTSSEDSVGEARLLDCRAGHDLPHLPGGHFSCVGG